MAVHLNRSRHRLAKGAPNRNPEHESRRLATSQQDADVNSAMPTAKFGIGECCHLGSEAQRWPFEHRAYRCGLMRGERDHPPIALQIDDSPWGTPLVS
jgi:hypothetical protein